MRHLCDPRGSCWDKIQQEPRVAIGELTASTVERLDEKDRDLRKQTRHAGHTQPQAVGNARTAVGKAIGRVRA